MAGFFSGQPLYYNVYVQELGNMETILQGYPVLMAFPLTHPSAFVLSKCPLSISSSSYLP